MAKINRFALYLCVLLVAACGHIQYPPVDQEKVVENVIQLDSATVPTEKPEILIIPEIPANDSSQRLDDDPPPNYQPERKEVVVVVPVKTKRELLREIYTSQIGVREKTGNNDGPAVERYLRSVGLGKGPAWCAAFERWAFDSAGIRTSITAWSPTAHNPRGLVWFKNKQTKPARPGDTFCLWYTSKGRIAHTGFFDRMINSGMIETVEGNTNMAGSREGDGVYRKKRVLNTVYSISDWIGD